MSGVAFTQAIPAGVTVESEPLRFGAPTGATDHVTACGWRYSLLNEPDGAVVAVYAFLDHVGVVRARGPQGAILALLATARPDWNSDDVIALAQLWDAAR
jgi:hypothetical protein